jgi:hypothetical protein
VCEVDGVGDEAVDGELRHVYEAVVVKLEAHGNSFRGIFDLRFAEEEGGSSSFQSQIKNPKSKIPLIR